MSNYYGSARSNYIKWDKDKLAALEVLFDITVISEKHGDIPTGRQTIISNDEGGTPDFIEPDQETLIDCLVTLGVLPSRDEVRVNMLLGQPTGIPEDISFMEVVHKAFAEDTDGVFIWMQVYQQSSRYLGGSSIAMDATGKILKQISLNDIYDVEGVKSEATY